MGREDGWEGSSIAEGWLCNRVNQLIDVVSTFFARRLYFLITRLKVSNWDSATVHSSSSTPTEYRISNKSSRMTKTTDKERTWRRSSDSARLISDWELLLFHELMGDRLLYVRKSRRRQISTNNKCLHKMFFAVVEVESGKRSESKFN